MFIVKGSLLGLVVFVVTSILGVVIAQQRGVQQSAVGLNVIRYMTINSGYWWLALVGAALIGIWFVRTV